MKKSIIILLLSVGTLFVLLNGCIIEKDEYTASFIENKTDHQLHFYYYSSIPELKRETIDSGLIVFPGEFKMIYSSEEIDSRSIAGIDSLAILYDNAKSAIHYAYNIQKPAGAGIGFDADRNFFNGKTGMKTC